MSIAYSFSGLDDNGMENKSDLARHANPPSRSKNDDSTTECKEARKSKDPRYVPVIIKRNDESRHHPDDTLEQAATNG